MHIDKLLKDSRGHWQAACALSQELIKGFQEQYPEKNITQERLTSFVQEIIEQGLEDVYIFRDTDISQVLAGENDSGVIEEIFKYAAKNYEMLVG